MYNTFFGLQKCPFNMTPDPGCLFLTAQHREALAGLSYAILAQKGFVVVTGDAGTGKTTVLAKTLQSLPKARINSSVILNPTLTSSEFLELALLDFGLTDVPASKAQRIVRFQSFLLQASLEGKISVLVVDEAHKLSLEVMEEIRLLGNFEHADRKLLQILLVGQDELGLMLDREDLRQFKQRVALRFAIRPLDPTDVAQYIQFRWVSAGGTGLPFSPESISMIAEASHGTPRVINALCDNALTLAFSKALRIVQPEHVREACADLHLSVATPPVQAPVTVELVNSTENPLPPEEPPEHFAPMRTLDRYGAPTKTSLLSRWAVKLGFTQKVEAA